MRPDLRPVLRPESLGLLAALAVLSGCLFDRPPEPLRVSGETMGTTYSVTAIPGGDGGDALSQEALGSRVEAVLAEVNAAMSNWDPGSEISRFNAHRGTDPVAVSAEMASLMAVAMEVHALSGGRFDITLAPLIELWGFGPRGPDSPVPDPAEIEAALAAVGQAEMLRLGDGTLAKAAPEVTANLSAIAKGHGVDRIARALEAEGIDRYLVEIGGDLRASGTNAEGAPWRVGIERPDAGSGIVEQVVALEAGGLATSGDYRNYFEADGVRYSHILDPVTGRPITHRTASVTVIASDAMRADALATALLVVDDAEAMRIAKQAGIAAFLILRAEDGDGFVTVQSPAFAHYLGSD